MKLQEFYITETVAEDSEINALSSAIARYLKRFETNDFDDDDEYDDHDLDDDDYLNVDMHTKSDEPIDVGTIGQLFDTPIEILNPIKIELQSDFGIRTRLKKDREAEGIKDPKSEGVLGLWYGGDEKTMVLNSDYLGTEKMITSITHELRHALDDFKSDFKAGYSTKYSTPRNKSHRKVTNDPYVGSLKYLAEPAEINARFIQVLHHLVQWINRAFVKLEPDQIKPFVFDKFKKLLDYHRISDLFPEKERSKDYKRLMKRGIEFMQKEIEYQEKRTGKKASGTF